MDALEILMQATERNVLGTLKREGEIMPGAVAEVTSPSARIRLWLPWRSDREKTWMLESLRELFAGIGVVRYTLWSECWLSTVTINGPRPTDLTHMPPGVPMPRDDPNRIDAVFIVAAEKGREPALFHHWEVVKDAAGQVIELKRIENAPDQAMGRVAELLAPRAKEAN